jgi:hypothetical protein
MTMDELLRLAKTYNELGWSVQEQLISIWEADDPEDASTNPNAVRHILEWAETAERAGVDNADVLVHRSRQLLGLED